MIGTTATAILAQIGGEVSDIANSLLLTETTSQPALVDNAAADTRQRFVSVISALNTQVAGRAIFSGQAYDVSPFDDAEAILANLHAVVSVETTVADALTAIDNWFAPGGRIRNWRIPGIGHRGATDEIGARRNRRCIASRD